MVPLCETSSHARRLNGSRGKIQSPGTFHPLVSIISPRLKAFEMIVQNECPVHASTISGCYQFVAPLNEGGAHR